jgi:hypothetical protein
MRTSGCTNTLRAMKVPQNTTAPERREERGDLV